MELTAAPEALEYLRRRDPELGAWIDRLGPLRRTADDDLFTSVVRQIVAQQISGKALETVWQRLADLPMTPRAVLDAGEARLRGAGMSARKASYILEFAQKAASGGLDLAALRHQTDGAVIETLTACRGIGVWTAEMVLLFGLHRPDVLSFGDYGIRKGLCRVHGLEALSAAQFARYRALYTPCGTAASLYLWEIARQ